MALDNCYGTMTELQAALNITNDEFRLEIAGNAAARQIDAHTGWTRHGFWLDSTVVTKTFHADDNLCLYIPEGIGDTTGLVVKTDTVDNGTYATTLTINSNFVLEPSNAALEYPARPYTEVRIVDYVGSFFPAWQSGRPGIQVTAKFGWPAVPVDVKHAWLDQSIYLYNSKDAPFGAIQFGEGSLPTYLGSGLNKTAIGLLERYCKPRVG